MTVTVLDPITAVSNAINRFVEVLTLWFKNEDKRRLRRGVDLADKIFKRYKEIHKPPDPKIESWINTFYDIMA